MAKEIRGISLGEKWDRIAPVVDAFAQRGARVTPKTVCEIRGGRSSGERTSHIMTLSEVLLSNNASHKNSTYAAFAFTRPDLKKRQKRYPQRLSSVGFTAEKAAYFDIRFGLATRIIEAMRADVAYSMLLTPKGERNEYLDMFSKVAEQYFKDYLNGNPYHLSPQAERLKGKWTKEKIEDFYKLLYENNDSRRAIGSWTPYEMEFFEAYYMRQQEERNKLSPFDKLVLEKTIHKEDLTETTDFMKERTGIPLDIHVLPVHINTLTGALQLTPAA